MVPGSGRRRNAVLQFHNLQAQLLKGRQPVVHQQNPATRAPPGPGRGRGGAPEATVSVSGCTARNRVVGDERKFLGRN